MTTKKTKYRMDNTKIRPRESISLTDVKIIRRQRRRKNSYGQRISNTKARMYNVRVPSDILEPYITCVRKCGFTQGEVISSMMRQWVIRMEKNIGPLIGTNAVSTDVLRGHSKLAIAESIDDTIEHLRRLSMDDYDEVSITSEYIAQPNNHPNARWRYE